ncbi:DUF262 domain-containing protein [Rufibacter sediminis]|uniref:DUF262 domain-containing protein n=1 Tax=Rufibacter sediminis TaxID=2762756 RepID=A0ABR6VSP7_9BACT|nr:DUF262 domain-containing protein [Rufibacter sediminis]MBC3539873.1 DUF262 domain-containing protein [Rufibacter sediminis]
MSTRPKTKKFLSLVDIQFVIPAYQRNYEWDYEQCHQLIQDIIKVGTSTDPQFHFIGSIVYIQEDVFTTDDIKELVVIDGQQRITTIILIYIALCAVGKELDNFELVDRIRDRYLINKYADKEGRLKLKPSDNNDKALSYLIQLDFDFDFEGNSRLLENFKFVQKFVTKENYEIIENGLNKLSFVEIILEKGIDNPQKIFESLNSTGKNLSEGDLIRNYIFMNMNIGDQNRVYKIWSLIENSCIQNDLNESRSKHIEFIRDYITLKSGDVPKKQRLKTYESFKELFKWTTTDNMENTVEDLKKYAVYYDKIINPYKEPDLEIRTQLRYLLKLDKVIAIPFVLQVYDDYKNKIINKIEFIEVLETIQSFLWRRFLCGRQSSFIVALLAKLRNEINIKDYVPSLQKALLSKLEKNTPVFPSNNEVRNILKIKNIYKGQTRNVNYLLERLENFDNEEPVLIDNNPKITIEHIFPVNPAKGWEQSLNKKDFNLLKNKYLHTLGNLTLSGNNGKLGNRFFLDKRDLQSEGKECGYKYSRLWLNKHLASLEKWDVEEVDKRFDLLFERFLQIWKLPTVDSQIKEHITFEETNILKLGDPTGKKIDYVLFKGKKQSIKNLTNLYTFVLRLALEDGKERDFKKSLLERFSIHSDDKKLKNALFIKDGYYAEAKINSRTKLFRIKEVVKMLGITDEISVKYSLN